MAALPSTAYDLRHIRSDAANKADANWTVAQDAWTSSGALSYELTGLDGGQQHDVQARAVNAAGDGPWSATVTGTPTQATPCATGGAVAGAANNPRASVRLRYAVGAPGHPCGDRDAELVRQHSDDKLGWRHRQRNAAAGCSAIPLQPGIDRHNPGGIGQSDWADAANLGQQPVDRDDPF